ncbi:hypothetical protein OC834_005069 [Tilletia horrida]|nr:hypothetical protein OC834_005069 [Tilletia horrida]
MSARENKNSSRRSAASRVLDGVPELALRVCLELRRAPGAAHTDLVALSRVSHALRNVALDVLVRDLDVRLSRVRLVTDFFREARPDLVERIQHVRVYDDVRWQQYAHRRACRPHRLPRTIELRRRDAEGDGEWEYVRHPERRPDPAWTDAVDFFTFLSMVRESPLPPLDFALGHLWLQHFQQCIMVIPRIAQSTIAIRLIVDDDISVAQRQSVGTARRWHRLRGEQWNQIGYFFSDFAAERERATESDPESDRPFRLLHLADSTSDVSKRPCTQPESWQGIATAVASSIDDLHICLCSEDGSRSEGLDALRTTWPHLRRFHLSLADLDANWQHSLPHADRLIEWFLNNHRHRLEDIDLQYPLDRILPQTFPNLRRFAIRQIDAVGLNLLLSQNPHLVELDVDAILRADSSPDSFVFPPASAAHLRILSAPAELAEEAVEQGARPAAYIFKPVARMADLELERWLLASDEVAQVVTMLDVEVDCTKQALPALVQAHGHTFDASHFPQLTELALSSVKRHHMPELRAEEDRVELVGLALSALRAASRLRVLRLEDMSSGPLPSASDRRLTLDASAVPPALEYLTWIGTACNSVQHFRILRDGSTAAAAGGGGGEDRVWLQELPASFGFRIGKEGRWEEIGSGREKGGSLFDHTVFPPQLK